MSVNTVFKAVTNTPGILVWRVEKLELVPVPPPSHGSFFEGDAYILLSTQISGTGYRYDVHCWLGSRCSLDEKAAAAIYGQQLDDHLGGIAAQHRQVQGQECPTFRGYFKPGLIYKKGGVATGMKHVETNVYNTQRLLHVKGKRNISAREVKMSWKSFNAGDVFLLDLGNVIIQWNGPQSNSSERLKGTLLAKDIRDRERGGRTLVGIVEGDKEQDSAELMKVLVSVLGKRPERLQPPTSDKRAAEQHRTSISLYQVSDANGQMKVTKVGSRPLVQDLLCHDDCYILDEGGAKIYVWKGRGATKGERQAAMSWAVEFIKREGYSDGTNIETVSDGAESAIFKQLFTKWTVRDETVGLGKAHMVHKVAKVAQQKFDATLMHAVPAMAAQDRMVDDGSGQTEVWRIENLELTPVEPEKCGFFYGGDCYLVLYTYLVNRRERFILYIWQGRHATQDEVTASALQAVRVDGEHRGEPVQVRVTMGREPKHFMAIFKGKIIIFEGGSSRRGSTQPEPPVRLVQVHGSETFNTKAIEVAAYSSSLNSNDVFLLKTESSCYLWCGKGSSGDEREMAKEVAGIIPEGEPIIVAEGQEPAKFWEALGGKAPYASDKKLQQEVPDYPPRLFECSANTGRFIVTEVTSFTQEDLSEGDVMLLDTWDQIFLWIGKDANKTERQESLSTAQKYLITHPSGRDVDTPIIIIKQGFEPPTFTGWFVAWDISKWSGGKPYEQLKNEHRDTAIITQITADLNRGNSKIELSQCQTFSLAMLINKQPYQLPQGVNRARKEQSLSVQDFKAVFGMSREEFEALPNWKQIAMKKDKALF